LDELTSFLGDHLALTGAAVALALALVVVEAKRAFRPWREVGPFELTALVNAGAVLLDLRGDKPFREGHIAGARRSESAEVAAALKATAKDAAIVLYCESGSVSDKAAETLAVAGYDKVATLRGGLATWRTENLPLARA